MIETLDKNKYAEGNAISTIDNDCIDKINEIIKAVNILTNNNPSEEDGIPNFIRLVHNFPWQADYCFIDDADTLYCKADFDKYWVSYCKVTSIMSSPNEEDLDFIFVKIKKKDRRNFENAMKSLDKRLAILKPHYLEMKERFRELLIHGEAEEDVHGFSE